MYCAQDILLEQRSLNQELQTKLGAALFIRPEAGVAGGQLGAASIPSPTSDSIEGECGRNRIRGGEPGIAALQQRIRFLEAQNVALRSAPIAATAAPQPAAQDGGAGVAEEYGSALPHDAAELAALRRAAAAAAALHQRNGFLEAQNSALRAAAAEAQATMPSASAWATWQHSEDDSKQPAAGSADTEPAEEQGGGSPQMPGGFDYW